jgi:hypothetical protein
LPRWCFACALLLAAALPRAVPASPYAMTLVWTAPGDDADVGRASSYDLRYSTAGVGADTLGWWSAASSAANVMRPSPSGQEDSTTVQGLSPETTYYFVLRTYDEVGNVSGFSNVAVGATDPGCPVPASMPSQFAAYVDSGQVLMTWLPTTDPLATAFHIWRGTGASGSLSLFRTITDPAQTSYRDTSAQPGTTYRYRATWSGDCGDGPSTGFRTLSIPDNGSPGGAVSPSAGAVAIHAYPNPSTDAVHFVIHVVDPSGERVQIRLFDLSGRVVADIADGSFPSGDTVISWPRMTRNGDRVAPGYYESIGTIGDASVRERLILLP